MMPCPPPYHLPRLPDWDCFGLRDYRDAGLLKVVPSVAEIEAFGFGYLAAPVGRSVRDGAGRYDPPKTISAQHTVALWVVHLKAVGVPVFAPFLTLVEMVNADCSLEGDFIAGGWEEYFAPVLGQARFVVVPPIEGWRESHSVWRAARRALMLQRPVYLVQENDLWPL